MSKDKEKAGSKPTGKDPAETEIKTTAVNIPGMDEDTTIIVLSGLGGSVEEFKEMIKASQQQ